MLADISWDIIKFVGSALVLAAYYFFSRKSKPADQTEEWPPIETGRHDPIARRRTEPAPGTPGEDWRKELERILSGEPAPPPPPPPVPVEIRPTPPPIPTARTAPPPLIRIPNLPSSLGDISDQTTLDDSQRENEDVLTEAAGAYARGGQLESRAVAFLQQATQQPVGLTRVEPVLRSAASQQLRVLLHDRQSLRAVLAAAIVLGPPKGLD